ncbi:cytoplasmic protein [Cryptococcus gattii E566]|uniref:Cytoplasm protein, putative n=2 Tax=Cryptococcus gattii TaxID=37769 RepID=E6RCQ5_CRYGW|nr:cytoplasm protein, putative [Cryptococcus gattii WM276]ADV24655.1 cytoplasm protein, putative [Cryptococcus gattii WM276]KIR80272.1 cytoplasmic protein [Cryptococcus gattii EJB2]KIY31466.1 cytoplasmic protein [Cryptococcus gattii E566]KJE00404.1 cytoplasmic protein [Cryptococcus gattii NT-10]
MSAPSSDFEHEPLATELHPISDATLTVRVIKSFEFRTQKSVILKNLDLRTLTVGALMDLVREEVKKGAGFKPYRNLVLDTMKLYTVAHGHKTQNLIINLDHDEWILEPSKTLEEVGAQNETELSFFNREAYEKFKLDPELFLVVDEGLTQVKWD